MKFIFAAAVALASAISVASARTTALDAARVHVVNVEVAHPSSDGGLTREVLYPSPATSLPVRVDAYVGAQLVSSCSFDKTTKT
jgi:hypothetical protein